LRKYAVVIEAGPNNYSAYVPDLPGCVSTGQTLDEIQKNIREAIEYHIEGMIEDGDPIPEPSSHAIEVEVSVA
jgi:predicted RNase H-like HicB family nuclease